MKNAILPFFTTLLVLLLLDCTDKKPNTNTDSLESNEQVELLEKESQEIKSLEQKIDNDIKELDALLEEI